MNARFVDIHCHPNLEGLKENQREVVERMREEGVLGIVVGTTLASSRDAVALAEKHEHLWATVGLHPNHTEESFDAAALAELAKHPKVVAVGECGVDYLRQSEREQQWSLFKQHVELAQEYDKPLMIHCRPSKSSMDAYEEMLEFLESRVQQTSLQGNMHFFVGNLDVAKRFWNLGFTTSFTGVLTFTHDYDEVVREAPLDMILTETDAPWVAPVPHRGHTNRPEYVRYVVEAIARIKGLSVDEVQKATIDNAKRLFGIEVEPRIA